jgi:phage gpG-like protein
MITLTVNYNKDTIKSINKYPSEVKKAIYRGFLKGMRHIEYAAKSSFGKKDKLKVQSGRYRGAITAGVDEDLTGWLKGSVVYAGIHEYGGVIKPKKGKYLKFKINGGWVSVKQVVIPKRPMLRPAIEDNLGTVGKLIKQEVLEALNGNN